MTQTLTGAPDLKQLRKQAKDLLQSVHQADPSALQRMREQHPELRSRSDEALRAVPLRLADAQLVLAREYGFASWPRLKKHVEFQTAAGRLKQAIDDNDVVAVRQMIHADRPLLRAPMGYGDDGPLTWAAECRGPATPPAPQRLEIARLLIEAGADVHAGGDGPLMRAALGDGRIPMVELLVAHGADVNARWHGHYPVVLAPCETLSPKALKWLLDHGADPNAREGEKADGGTALDMVIDTYARGEGQAGCIEVLLAAGGTSRWAGHPIVDLLRDPMDLLAARLDADPALLQRQFTDDGPLQAATAHRALDLHGATLLHAAAEYNRLHAARLLLDRGADANVRADVDANGVGGQTPLFHAVTQYRDAGVPVAELLIERGADLGMCVTIPSAYDRPGETLTVTPLGFAARFPPPNLTTGATTDLLVRHGAPAGDVYAAARLGLVDELRGLLAAGADPNTAHPCGETALAAALASGHTAAGEMLRSHGAE